MKYEIIGTTYEDDFGRIEWFLDLETNSTFCIPEIDPVFEQFCKEIAAATEVIKNEL